jgi:hypothetical protein
MSNYDEARNLVSDMEDDGRDKDTTLTRMEWLAIAQTRAILAVADAVREQVPPGPCWADSGITWPNSVATTRCELLAGHAGAHQADRGLMGGTAVWTDAEAASA